MQSVLGLKKISPALARAEKRTMVKSCIVVVVLVGTFRLRGARAVWCGFLLSLNFKRLRDRSEMMESIALGWSGVDDRKDFV